MIDIKDLIRKSELFSAIDGDIIDRITERFAEIRFDTDEVLCRENDPGDRMFIIAGGEVSVRKNMGWGQRELQVLKAGEVVGEMSLISEERRSATVVATTPTTCLQMNSADFKELLSTEPRFAQQIAIILTKRLSDLGRRTGEDILNAYRALMFSLANLAETRDPDTGAHLNRTRSYCALLSELLSSLPEYGQKMGRGYALSMYQISPLHDIGKVAIPDRILLKPDRLTDDEYETMKKHTVVGARALENVLEYSNQEIFHMGRRICRHHHERWDGTGYPDELSGERIPLEARIMALADVYDALLSRRVYKPALRFDAAKKEIQESAGSQFDPVLSKVMIENIELFERVHQRHQNE